MCQQFHGAGVAEASGHVLELWQQVLQPAIVERGICQTSAAYSTLTVDLYAGQRNEYLNMAIAQRIAQIHGCSSCSY